MRCFSRDLKAVSPVIATIIIVAVAIVMSIAVAYWMLGLSGTFTRYEKIEFTAAYADALGGNKFNVTLIIKNTGTSTATVTEIFINGRPLKKTDADYICSGVYKGTDMVIINGGNDLSLNPGVSATLIIKQLQGGADVTLKPGMTVEIMLQTAAGNQYPKTIVLP